MRHSRQPLPIKDSVIPIICTLEHAATPNILSYTKPAGWPRIFAVYAET